MVAIPRAALELIVMLLHPALELRPIVCELGRVRAIRCQILHLIWIRLIVEEKLRTVSPVDRVGVLRIAQSAPLGAILPGRCGPHSLHVDRFRTSRGAT